ncbi:MAG: hypothetical protein K6C35_00730 [Eubacterium sp.]|nr:hypothetical protein [Eubacterium sp.]
MSKKGYGKRVISGILCFSLMTGLMPGGLRSKVYAETEIPNKGEVQEIEVTGQQASSLTVFDGTDTNQYVPLYGNYTDVYQKTQYVIPADKLKSMNGKYIESITYYLSEVAANPWDGGFEVYLKEVDYTTMESCDNLDGATLVYSGGLDGTQNEMNIELQDNYKYMGGNLLIAIYVTTVGGYNDTQFYGVATEDDTSLNGINDESIDKINYYDYYNFIPKTTFAYSEEPSFEHTITYTAEGDTITAACSEENCIYANNKQTLQIIAPEQAYYDGEPWEATLSDYNSTVFPVVGEIEYYQGDTKLESAPVEAGVYTASVTVGEGDSAATAITEFGIASELVSYTINSKGAMGDCVEPLWDQSVTKYYVYQSIIKAEELKPMVNKSINGIQFYLDQPSEEKLNGIYKIYLEQTDLSEIESADLGFNVPEVYWGTLDTTSDVMNIQFLGGSYKYEGGNLRLSIVSVKPSDNYEEFSFIGIYDRDSRSYMGSGNSLSALNKVEVYSKPKMTFFFGETEEHHFEYTADGDTITAKCTDDGCKLDDLPMTIIPPENNRYDGSPKEAKLNDYSSVVFPGDYVIEYYQGETKLESAPVNKGSYKAKVTVGEGEKAITASVSFEINNYKEITVYDGTDTSNKVPLYGYFASYFGKGQYIIPADKLEAIKGAKIEAIEYYLSQSAGKKWGGEYKVYLKEVEYTEFSDAYDDLSNASLVYTGKLDGTGKTMYIKLQEGYTYNGGNLLVAIYRTEKDQYSSAYFYGVETDYASALQGSSPSSLDKVSVSTRQFIPQTSFYYKAQSEHNFSYEADGNVITATCDEEECDITEGLTLTVNAPEDLGYDGEAKEATLSDYSEIVFPVVGEIEYYQGDTKLESAPVEIGSYTAKVTVGEGDKAVVVSADYTIAPAEFDDDFVFKKGSSKVKYTGSKVKTSVKVLYDAGGDSFTLEKGKDYTVTYSNNVNIGTAKITVKGIGNFTGEKILYFKIVTNLTAQPKNKTVNCGKTAVFSAAQDIQGDITYEWQISQNNGNTWKKSGVSGQGTDTINVTAKANYDGYMFRCKISNGTWTEYTKPATLKVKAVISEKPVDKKAYYGNVARFTVKAAGPDMNYQWQVMNASGKWVNSSASGAATATLSVTATSSLNGKKFRCVITSKNNTLTTAEVTLTTVNNIKTQPVDRKVKVGAKTVFTVKAAGNDLSYQWQVYVNGKWVKSGAEGSDTDKLTVTGNMKYNGYKFRCLVTNGTVKTYSDAATLVVTEK